MNCPISGVIYQSPGHKLEEIVLVTDVNKRLLEKTSSVM